MNLPEINITSLHESIKKGVIERFPGCSVDYYSRPGEQILTPAIFFELEDVVPADPSNIGTEQLGIKLEFSAAVIESYKETGLLNVRLLALGLAKCVDGNRWGEPVSPGQYLGAAPGEFAGPMDAYESWRVSWSHTALLGKNIWEEIGTVPVQVMVSTVPKIGIPHESDYIPIAAGREAVS